MNLINETVDAGILQVIIDEIIDEIIGTDNDDLHITEEDSECVEKANADTANVLKKRKICETNCFELVVAALILNASIHNYDDLVVYVNSMHLDERFQCKYGELPKFIADLIIRPPKTINTFIHEFRSQFIHSCNFNYDDVSTVYLTGKCTNGFPEIEKLNEKNDVKSSKSDIYIKTTTGDYVGFSIKQSTNATKSNYSVQKMLPKEVSAHLDAIKQSYLSDNGFATHDDSKRKEVNKLFYTANPYFDHLKMYIEQYKFSIVSLMIKHLYCGEVEYDVYEFDGKHISKLNGYNMQTESITFTEHLPFYLMQNGKQRNCAKLFYKLDVPLIHKITNKLSISSYRVELRWKGNIHHSSPQFMIHMLEAVKKVL
jgi:hypothetical protein